MFATFNRFELQMTKTEARSCSHPGPCDDDVAALTETPKLRRQLAKILDAELAAELREYGAWTEEELANRAANELRIVWIAAGNISELDRDRVLA